MIPKVRVREVMKLCRVSVTDRLLSNHVDGRASPSVVIPLLPGPVPYPQFSIYKENQTISFTVRNKKKRRRNIVIWQSSSASPSLSSSYSFSYSPAPGQTCRKMVTPPRGTDQISAGGPPPSSSPARSPASPTRLPPPSSSTTITLRRTLSWHMVPSR